MFAHRNVSWTVEQSGCIFSVTIAGFPVLNSAIGNGFSMLLWAFAKLYIPHMPKFCMPTFGNGRNNTKTACICLYRVWFFPTCIGKPGAIFSAHVNIRQTSSVPVVMPGFRQTVFALRRSWHSTVPPAPLISCHWVMRGGRQGTSVCRFKSVPICGPISACAARWSPTKKQNIRVVIEFVSDA